MKQLVLGTAGHIDHGKTTLIKALTGIDTDRLKEEKARGITIELGFAHLDLPSGQRLGIVDVPGHEKFVKNMVAGAAGIDLVALVIAADEGVMPQTREHLDICKLLDVRTGLVVLTKVDMVDEEWLELVSEDVREYLQGTFLKDAPIIPVSGVAGTGLDELLAALDAMAAGLDERPAHGPFRLPVDRVFSMKGFGTVITGTAIAGTVEVGQEVQLYPGGDKARVRGLQVHNADVQTARRGQRTAMNLQGLEKAAINRGDVVATPGSLTPSLWLDLHCSALSDMARPLKHRAPVRFHSGTAEIMGRVLLLDRDELLPGDSAACQIRLEQPASVMARDRFVLRSYSPVDTIAGGLVLHPSPGRHKRRRPEVMADLETLLSGEPAQQLLVHARLAGPAGVTAAALAPLLALAPKELDGLIQQLLSKKELVRFDKDAGRLIAAPVLEGLMDQAASLLEEFHQRQPLKPGMSREELKQRLGPAVEPRLFAHLLGRLEQAGRVESERDILRLAGHEIKLAGGDAALLERIEKAYAEGGTAPPNLKDVLEGMDPKKGRSVLGVLVDQGRLVRIREDLHYHSDALETLRAMLVEYLNQHGEIGAAQFKEITGLSRKYIIPLLEYFDAKGVTIRVGDVRKLRGRQG